MSSPDDLLRAGDLDGARRALVEAVRDKPGDAPTRMFLFQLLALSGEWTKARTQLETLARLSPEAGILAVVYGQAMTAEIEREAVFAGADLARQHMPSPWLEGITRSIQLRAAGNFGESDDLRSRSLDEAPDAPGTIDGTSFDWIADADARFGPSFEAIIDGRYGLQSFDQVEKIESEGPCDLRDLVWYPVQIAFRDGRSTAALLPTRYPGSHAAVNQGERLARATGWNATDGVEEGSGQHLWMTSGGEDHGLLSLRLLTFA